MTAKERLLEVIGPLSEEQAERLLPLFERGEDPAVIGMAIGAELRAIKQSSGEDPGATPPPD